MFLSLPCPPQEYAETQFTGLSDDGQSRTFQVVDSGLQCEHGARVSARIAQLRAAKRQLEAQRRERQKQQPLQPRPLLQQRLQQRPAWKQQQRWPA